MNQARITFIRQLVLSYSNELEDVLKYERDSATAQVAFSIREPDCVIFLEQCVRT